MRAPVAFLGGSLQYFPADAQSETSEESFRDGPKDQTSDVQLHIGESRDSGFALCAPRNDSRLSVLCDGLVGEIEDRFGKRKFQHDLALIIRHF